ncbi:MAG: VCBS repeat-containing protein [Pyrinomonadaceae bacterium]|nr:VCBS repeat-containing protein [Pyrinomonadaceae bacterium]
MKAVSRNIRLVWKQFLSENLYLNLILAFCFFFLTVSIQASPGDIDTIFGGDGRVFSPFTQQAKSNTVLIQADGKIIVAGGGISGTNNTLFDFALVRYYSNGSIDTSFGNNGVVLTDMRASQFVGSPDSIADAAILSDGKIVVAGRAAYNYGAPFDGSVFGIARYLSSGTLDNSFSDDGKVFFGSFHDAATSLEVQADGKILVAGTRGRCPDCINPTKFIIVKFNTDGTKDTSFGDSGSVVSGFTSQGDSTGDSLALQPDGKIIVAGFENSGFGIARHNTDGTLDSSFGSNGVISLPFANIGSVFNMITQPDGKIIVLGSSLYNSNSSDFVVLRFDANGTPDNSFGVNGRVITAISNVADVANHVVYQPDGKIIVVGFSRDYNTGGVVKAVLVRYNPNGSLDSAFGEGGIVLTPNYGIFRAALQPDGKIVTTDGSFTMVRYRGDAPFAQPRRDFDFTGDGLADFTVARNIEGYLYWYVARNPASELILARQWGIATDKIVPADYDGDGKTDVAVFRDGNWFILRSSDNSFSAVAFGTTDDIPVPADYTGDGRAELAVYRNGTWFTFNLVNDDFQTTQFGNSSDKTVQADYDGDGKTDIAVVRRENGQSNWYILGSTRGFYVVQFGIASDKPTVGDYDGDEQADQAVYRNGVWYVLGSTQGFYTVQFGIESDIPVAADYDGDGKTDVAVFRDGVWYLLGSQQGFGAIQFGIINDRPIPAAYAP